MILLTKLTNFNFDALTLYFLLGIIVKLEILNCNYNPMIFYVAKL